MYRGLLLSAQASLGDGALNNMKKHATVHWKENSVNLAVKDVKFCFDTDWYRDKLKQMIVDT